MPNRQAVTSAQRHARPSGTQNPIKLQGGSSDQGDLHFDGIKTCSGRLGLHLFAEFCICKWKGNESESQKRLARISRRDGFKLTGMAQKTLDSANVFEDKSHGTNLDSQAGLISLDPRSPTECVPVSTWMEDQPGIPSL